MLLLENSLISQGPLASDWELLQTTAWMEDSLSWRDTRHPNQHLQKEFHNYVFSPCSAPGVAQGALQQSVNKVNPPSWSLLKTETTKSNKINISKGSGTSKSTKMRSPPGNLASPLSTPPHPKSLFGVRSSGFPSLAPPWHQEAESNCAGSACHSQGKSPGAAGRESTGAAPPTARAHRRFTHETAHAPPAAAHRH